MQFHRRNDPPPTPPQIVEFQNNVSQHKIAKAHLQYITSSKDSKNLDKSFCQRQKKSVVDACDLQDLGWNYIKTLSEIAVCEHSSEKSQLVFF